MFFYSILQHNVKGDFIKSFGADLGPRLIVLHFFSYSLTVIFYNGSKMELLSKKCLLDRESLLLCLRPPHQLDNL